MVYCTVAGAIVRTNVQTKSNHSIVSMDEGVDALR